MQPLTFVAQPQLLLLVVLVLVSQDSRRIQAFPTLVVPPASSRLVPSLSSSSSFVRPIHSSWLSTGFVHRTRIMAETSPNNRNDNDNDVVQKDDHGEPTVLFSLAGPYLLAFDRADDTLSSSSSTTTQSCRFYQLDELDHDTQDGSDTVLAWSSVQQGHACITGVPACLELQVEVHPSDDQNHQVLLTLHHNLNNKNDDETVDWNLVQIIARILVQQAVQPWIQEPAESSSSTAAAGTHWTVSWTTTPSINPGHLSLSFSSFVVSRDTWVADLYHGIWNVTDTTEVAELVDATGRPLGHVPRQLVHSYNLLHRGIGVLVYRRPSSPEATTDLDHDDDDNDDLTRSLSKWQLYVHQRTATKRLFPSLYDMFVGGVSLATEEARVTAEREVAEELGLHHGRTRLHSWPGLVKPCLVCTAVNRCVVTLFGYPTTATTTTAQQQQEDYDDNDDETIVWQPEEVAWGAFVPYPVVHASAQQSVQRLVQSHHWPGRRNQGLAAVQRAEPNHPQQSFFNDDKDNDSNSPDWPASWQEWDYVPDGLLVWEAWLEWLEHSTKTNINNKNQLLSS